MAQSRHVQGTEEQSLRTESNSTCLDQDEDGKVSRLQIMVNPHRSLSFILTWILKSRSLRPLVITIIALFYYMFIMC